MAGAGSRPGRRLVRMPVHHVRRPVRPGGPGLPRRPGRADRPARPRGRDRRLQGAGGQHAGSPERGCRGAGGGQAVRGCLVSRRAGAEAVVAAVARGRGRCVGDCEAATRGWGPFCGGWIHRGSGRMIYFNEWEPFAAEWLRNLYPEATVDERSIAEVQATDVVGPTHVALFGGCGGWQYALDLARWPRDRPVWSCSCPCPPFSSAGKKQDCPACGGSPVPCPRRTGTFICLDCEHAWLADERHLWPEVWRLIRDARPAIVFGEQVSSPDGRIWLAGVRASLAAIGYSVGAADLAAASVGAPHIRQRIFWVAKRLDDPDRARRQGRGGSEGKNRGRRRVRAAAGPVGPAGPTGPAAGRLGEPSLRQLRGERAGEPGVEGGA